LCFDVVDGVRPPRGAVETPARKRGSEQWILLHAGAPPPSDA
jgi:hypothetical protein